MIKKKCLADCLANFEYSVNGNNHYYIHNSICYLKLQVNGRNCDLKDVV